MGQFPVNRFRPGDPQQLSAGLLFQRLKRVRPDERHLQLNMQGIIQPRHVMQRLERGEIVLQGGVLKVSQRPGDHCAQGFR